MAYPVQRYGFIDKKNELLRFLKKHGALTTDDLRRMLHVSKPTLSKLVNDLEYKDPLIETYKDLKDRRKTWVRLKSERIKTSDARVGRHEVLRFIESISNPVYASGKEGKIAAFTSVPATVNRKEWERKAQSLVGGRVLVSLLFKLLPSLKHGQKMAVVIMVEGEGVRP